MEKITTKELDSLCRWFRKSIKKLNLSMEEYCYLMDNDFDEDLVQTIREIAITDKYFGHTLKTFTIRIPKNYDPTKHILEFTDMINESNHYSVQIEKDYFPRSTDQLIPGKKYTINFYPILIEQKGAGRMACINFLKKKKSLLVGPEGLATAWGLAKQQFPESRYVFSLDYMKRLLINKTKVYFQPNVCLQSSGKGYADGNGITEKKSVNLFFCTECCLISFTEI